METKTFEELKQLAIQIRDEKTNKQNTATRVGTAMLEHINKLEQDYYDKTQTDEELKERDDKLTEIEKKSVYSKKINFEQGEFNYNLDPVELNGDGRRIRTIIRAENLRSIKVTNPNYAISAGFIMNESLDKSKIKIIDDFENIDYEFIQISYFDPIYLVFSIRRTDNGNLTPADANSVGLEIDYNLDLPLLYTDKNVFNKGLLLNTEPYFEQGEFNYNLDPVEYNNVTTRIRTIINISNIKSIFITNTEEYVISAGFYTDSSLDLAKSKIKIANVTEGKSINIKNDIDDIVGFTPTFLVVSFRNINDQEGLGYPVPMRTIEWQKLGLNYETCNTVYEVQKSNYDIDTLKYILGGITYYPNGFEQGEFNWNSDPVSLNTVPHVIRRIFDIENITKIEVLNKDYEIRNYILMKDNESLKKDDIVYGSVSSSSLDVDNLIKSQSKIDTKKILVSFGRVSDRNIGMGEQLTKAEIVSARIVSMSTNAIIDGNKEIVCPGDSLTAGDGIGEYPMELQKILGNNYTVINQGVGGETSHTILARVGSEAVYSQYDFILPNAGQKVLIADGTTGKYLKNATSDGNVTPLLQNVSERVNPCYVNGVRCIMTREYTYSPTNASDNKWYLTPQENGKNITIKKGTPIILQGSNVCRNKDLLIEWIGTNDGQSAIQSDIDGFVKRLRNSVQFANPKCCIILNPHVFVLEDFDNALRKEFGNQFFNWRVYVSSVALYEFGITPTTQETLTELQKQNGVLSDVECMEAGTLPSSLWRRAYRSADDPLNDTGRVENEKDSTHMNVMGYKILATKLSQLINELGL